MKPQKWIVAFFGVCMLTGSATVESVGNIQDEPYQYPENPDLDPLASAIYRTVRASASDFSTFETTPASAARVDTYIDRIAETIKHNAMPRDMRISVLDSHKKAEHVVPDLSGIFSDASISPDDPLLVSGVKPMAHQTQTTLTYRLPYETRAEAKQVASQLATALKRTAMPASDGWTWTDKEARIAQFKEAIEIGKQNPTEAGQRQAAEHEANFKKKLEAGKFDSFSATYQWYPGSIDMKTGRVINLGLAYSDKGLEVGVSRMRPDK